MVKNKAGLNKSINNYLNIIRKDIKINCAILFGSYAKGTPEDESDIDLVIVSENFGENHIKDMQYLSVKRLNADSSIEAIAISLADFKNRQKGDFITEIYEKGILLEENL